MATYLEQVRTAFPDLTKKGYSDEEVVLWLADKNGADPQEVGELLGVYDPDQGDFSRGISAGVDSTQAMAFGAGALAADTFGADDARNKLLRGYQKNMAEVQLRSRPTDTYEGINSLGDAADFAQYYSGYGLAQGAQALATGGLGTLVGKQVVKQGLKRQTKDLLADSSKELIERGGKIGGYSGIGVQAVGTELGATYGGAVDRALETGQSIDDIDKAKVYGYGTLAGAMEGVADVATLGLARMGPGKSLMDAASKSRVRGAAAGATKGAAVEGVTEGVQTGLEDLGAGYSLDEARFFDPTSVLAGAIGGGQLGGVGGALRNPESSATDLNKTFEGAKDRVGEQLELDLDDPTTPEQLEARYAEEERKAEAVDRLTRDRQAANNEAIRAEGEIFDTDEFRKQIAAGIEANVADRNSDLGREFLDVLNTPTEDGASGIFGAKAVKKARDKFIKDKVAAQEGSINQAYEAELVRRVAEKAKNQDQIELDFNQLTGEEKEAAVAQERQREIDTPAQSRKDAIAQTERLLGADWVQSGKYDDLASAINGKAFTRKKYAEALKAAANPQAAPQAAEAPASPQAAPVNALAETETAPAAAPPENVLEFGTTKDSKPDVSSSAPVVKATNNLIEKPLNSKKLGLSKNEQKIADVLQEASQDGTLDTLFEPDGTPMHTEIRARAELNSRQASRTSIDRIMNKIAKAQGLTVDQIKTRLRETKYRDGQGNVRADESDGEVSVNAPTAVAPPVGSEGMSAVNSAAGSQSEGAGQQSSKAKAAQNARFKKLGMTPAQIKAFNEKPTEDRAALAAENEAKAAESKDARMAVHRETLQSRLGFIRNSWQDQKAPGDVNFSALNEEQQVEFMLSMGEHMETSIADPAKADRTLKADIKALSDAAATNAKEITNETTQIEQKPTVEVQERRTDENLADAPRREETGASVDADGREAVSSTQQKTPVVETKPKKRVLKKPPINSPKYKAGIRDDLKSAKDKAKATIAAFAAPKTASRETFGSLVEELTGKKTNWRVNLYDDVADYVAALLLSTDITPVRDAPSISQLENGTFGWVVQDKNGIAQAHFILSNIPAGSERAAFMHEVGSHMGIDEIIDESTRAQLEHQIYTWANREGNALESVVARKAMDRVDKAARTDERLRTDGRLVQAEVIAYFIEEATEMGVEPSAKTPLGLFLRKLYALFKNAIRKIQYNSDALGTQDIVDLAYGAARIQLSARRHGATATFRRFDHQFMSSGEGAQAYGWGSYLAERFSIARWYLRNDEARKYSRDIYNARWDGLDPLDKTTKMDEVSSKLAAFIENYKPASRNVLTSEKKLLDHLADKYDYRAIEQYKQGNIYAEKPPFIQFVDKAKGVNMSSPVLGVKVSYPTKGTSRISYDLWSMMSEQGSDAEVASLRAEVNDMLAEKKTERAAYQESLAVEGNLVTVDTTVNDEDMLPWLDPIISRSGAYENAEKMLMALDPVDTLAILVRTQKNNPFMDGTDIVDRTEKLKSQYKRGSASLDDFRYIIGETISNVTGKDLYRAMQRHDELDSNVLMSAISDEVLAKPEFRYADGKPDADFNILHRSDKVVSAVMDQFGIGGIIYPDANTLGASGKDKGVANNVVIFNDKNLIVVSRTPGKQVSDKDSTVNEIRYGVKKDWAATFQGPKAKPFLDNASFVVKAGTRSLKFLHQIVEENREKIPAVGRWYDAMLAAEATRNEIRRQFEDIALRATQLEPARMDAVNDFIGNSTFFQKWGYDPEIDGKTVKVDPIMKRAFDSLSESEQQLAKDVFAHGENMRQRKIAIAKSLGVSGKFFTEAALDGPYAPLKRFGNFAGELKSQQLVDAENKRDALDPEAVTKELRDKINELKSDPDHYMISFFDTPGAAGQFVDANKNKYAFAQASERDASMEEDRMGNPAVYEKVLGALKADDKAKIDPEAKKAFQDMVKNLYFQSLDERSARLSGARRMSRAGYDKNMMRSFLSHARAEASLISQMENGTEVNTAFAEVAQQVSKNRPELGSTGKMIVRHYKDTLNQVETPIQDRVAAANSVYMLTTSIGYHVTNATQPIMVTVPRIAGDFNDYSKTWTSLFKGYGVARKIIDGSFFNQVKTAATVGMLGDNQVGIDVSKAPPEYRKLLEYLQLHQLLDVGMEEDLGMLDKFDTGNAALNKASDFLGGITHRLYQVARYVEAHNRISSAIAAYDMAKQNRGTVSRMKMTPMEYATSVVQDTQGNFSRLDAPLLLKALPKVMVQYRKYQFLMAWHYANAFNQGFFGESPEVKFAGRRVLGYSIAHAALGAGATGVPLLGSMYWAFMTMFGDEDEPEDLERSIRMNIKDEKLADVLTRGLPAFLGLDMSTKLSQGKIFQPLPYVDFEASDSGAKDVFFGAFAGPAGTTGVNFFRAAGYMQQGDMLKAIEYSVPKGVRSATETFRLATEGYSLKNGDIVIDPREINIGSLMVNAMGLPSTEINKVKWTRGQQYELTEYFSKESSRIRKEFIEARRDRDRATQKELRQEWRDLQDAKDRVRPFFNNERGTLRRQSVSDLMKAPRRQSKREDKYRKQLTGN